MPLASPRISYQSFLPVRFLAFRPSPVLFFFSSSPSPIRIPSSSCVLPSSSSYLALPFWNVSACRSGVSNGAVVAVPLSSSSSFPPLVPLPVGSYICRSCCCWSRLCSKALLAKPLNCLCTCLVLASRCCERMKSAAFCLETLTLKFLSSSSCVILLFLLLLLLLFVFLSLVVVVVVVVFPS